MSLASRIAAAQGNPIPEPTTALHCQRRHVHDGRNAARYYHRSPSAAAVLCRPCVTKMNADGMDWRLDLRERVIPVDRERRGFVPAWLSRLTARDDTGRLVA